MAQIKDKAVMEIAYSEFKTIFLNHVRYCMTRHSYLVSKGFQDVKNYWHILESDERKNIKRDISEHLDFYKCQKDSEQFGRDYKIWEDLLTWCMAQDKQPQPVVDVIPDTSSR